MQQSRMVWLDALRLTAGVSMVGLHATSDAQGLPFADYAVSERWGPLIIRAVVYTARTELFLVISLFLLMMSFDRRPRPYRTVIAEQMQRLLLPFAFWTVFFALYNLNKSHFFGYQDWVVAQLSEPQVWAKYLLLGSSKYHMHFLPTLFGLVLFFPLFLLAVRRPVLGLLVFAGLLLKRELDGLIWSNLYDDPVLPWVLRAVKILTYCGYGMVAGAFYGMWRQKVSLRPWFVSIIAIGGGLFAIKLYATYLTGMSGDWQFGFVPGYWADFLMPVVLFAAMMAMCHKRWSPHLSKVAKYSFGIYLCHPIFLDLLEITFRDVAWAPTTIVVLKIAIAIPATAGLVWTLEQSRIFAWTVGLGPVNAMWSLQKRSNANA